MRVILEMTEAESRTVTVERHVLAQHEPAQTTAPGAAASAAAGPAAAAMPSGEAQPPAPAPAGALDGGAPSTALLVALGDMAPEGPDEGHGGGAAGDGDDREGGMSAGAAPDWLREILGRSPN